ncbi:enolase-phosphatase E1 [Lingula anatina]|uniref:Enolase-phosphatase E1 n=1 Tax=Lingula anatina TaxID=7574 RepID=A0A1S3IGZ7_LINAN|nr:enolase-phosphatase E1 [Lingula anatina]|eukprot:XP_013397492.2 enolase-phosphatase E1 [Lingula anatina]
MAQTKRPISDASDILENVKVLLLDVEGTTSPISFMKNEVNQYVTENIQEYLTKNWESEELQNVITSLREQAQQDKEAGTEGVVEVKAADDPQEEVIASITENLKWQMSQEKATTAACQLQSQILREAFKMEKMKGKLFDDVVPALKEVATDSRQVYLFSTTSMDVQKLLFTYSAQGDNSKCLSGFFDSKVGAKTEMESYKNIINDIGVKPEETLYVTDMPAEAQAAGKAGIGVFLLNRPENPALSQDDLKDYNVISSLTELYASNEAPCKKATNGADVAQVEGEEAEAEDEEGEEDVVDDEEEEDLDGEDEEGEEEEEEEEAQQDKEAGTEGVVEVKAAADPQEEVIASITENLKWQMSQEKATTAACQLQSQILREAFKMEKMKGKLFDDVVPALKEVATDSRQVYLFSTTSMDVQKLLFTYSAQGDNSKCLSGFFDSKVGAKTEMESYKNIINDIGVKPEETLYVTDTPAEAQAAGKAGIGVFLLNRPDNPALSQDDLKDYNVISSLTELYASNEAPCKKATNGADVAQVEGEEAEAEDEEGEEDVVDDEEEEDLDGEDEEGEEEEEEEEN